MTGCDALDRLPCQSDRLVQRAGVAGGFMAQPQHCAEIGGAEGDRGEVVVRRQLTEGGAHEVDGLVQVRQVPGVLVPGPQHEAEIGPTARAQGAGRRSRRQDRAGHHDGLGQIAGRSGLGTPVEGDAEPAHREWPCGAVPGGGGHGPAAQGDGLVQVGARPGELTAGAQAFAEIRQQGRQQAHCLAGRLRTGRVDCRPAHGHGLVQVLHPSLPHSAPVEDVREELPAFQKFGMVLAHGAKGCVAVAHGPVYVGRVAGESEAALQGGAQVGQDRGPVPVLPVQEFGRRLAVFDGLVQVGRDRLRTTASRTVVGAPSERDGETSVVQSPIR